MAAAVLMVWKIIDSSDRPLAGLANKAETVEIVYQGETTVLAKQDAGWVVASQDNQVADQAAVAEVFSTLADLDFTDVASRNTDRQALYQVDASGWEITVKKGEKVLAHFWVGKNGPAWPSSYLRLADSAEVFLVRANLPQIFGLSDWRDMTIVQIDNSLVTELFWNNGLRIAKTETGWQITSPYELTITEDKIKTVLNNLSNLQASDLATLKSSDLTQTADFILEVKTSDNQTQRLSFYRHDLEAGGYDYYVTREGGDLVYILSKYVAENLEKEISFFEE